MSDSREAVLGAVRRAQPEPRPRPEAIVPPDFGDLLDRFAAALVGLEARLIRSAPGDRMDAAVRQAYPEAEVVASTVDEVAGTRNVGPATPVEALAALDLFIGLGELGVAENGAIWLPESRMGHRAAPFLAQHLCLVLEVDRIVGTMHDAYAVLRISDQGFGVFIAGASRTADIEQSLVLGAHGPRSLTVILVDR